MGQFDVMHLGTITCHSSTFYTIALGNLDFLSYLHKKEPKGMT